MNLNKLFLAALICFGIFSVIISYLGFFMCGCVGVIGIFKVFYDLFFILEGIQSFTVNLYPLTGIFVVPTFYMLIIQFLNYIRMIYLGVNQKTELSIYRFNQSSNGKLVHQISFKIGVQRLIKFFFWRDIHPSELTREMTVDAKLDYESPPDGTNGEILELDNSRTHNCI